MRIYQIPQRPSQVPAAIRTASGSHSNSIDPTKGCAIWDRILDAATLVNPLSPFLLPSVQTQYTNHLSSVSTFIKSQLHAHCYGMYWDFLELTITYLPGPKFTSTDPTLNTPSMPQMLNGRLHRPRNCIIRQMAILLKTTTG